MISRNNSTQHGNASERTTLQDSSINRLAVKIDSFVMVEEQVWNGA